jgi:hypothetical protein
VRKALLLRIQNRFGYQVGTGFVPKERDEPARIENKSHGRDSKATSSLLRLMNDSLEV